MRWAMQLQSVTVQRGNAELYRQSRLVILHEQGLRYDAGFVVPVLMSGWGMKIGRVSGCVG